MGQGQGGYIGVGTGWSPISLAAQSDNLLGILAHHIVYQHICDDVASRK